MDLSKPSGLHLLISGIVLWLIGAVIGILVPAFAPVGVILLIIAAIRGAL
jgi:hypothetical protein